MSNAMTVATRRKVTERLRGIWNKRDIPSIPDQELRRVTDRDLAYLLRFWSHVDRHWDEENAAAFTEEPPQGYAKMFAPVQTPAGDIIGGEKPRTKHPAPCDCDPHHHNSFHEFKTSGGGALTFRQALRLKTQQY